MANPGVKFVVYDEFDSKIGDDNGISLKIEPQRTVENLDHKVLVPMKITYNKKAKDSLIQISARPTGNEGLSTYESFRGQFFSTVVDEKYDQTPNSIPHLIEQKNPTKKMYVERRTWEEGITPTIQIITNQLDGVLDIHFLAIVSATERRTKIDTSVGIEISVKEIGIKTGNSRPMGTFEISFDESSEHEFLFHEDSVISTFEEKSLQIVGEGSSIHPKQLITVDSLRSSLTSEVTEIFQSEKIDLGYIGLDTGENILSVIRYIKREGLSNQISCLNIFYEEKWDGSYKKRLEPLIDNAADFDVEWHEVSELVALSDEEKEKKRDEFSVDFMISTYVAVWAANEEKIEIAEAEHYFRNAYEWCKEKALLLSIDPMDKLKIARSHRLAGRIDPTPYYKKGGFTEWKDSLGVGDSTICKETLWIKGDLRLESKLPEAKKLDIEKTNASVENISSNVNTRVSNRLTEFIENNAGLIDCAGIPTEASKLVKAQVLDSQHTLFVIDDEYLHLDVIGKVHPKKSSMIAHKVYSDWPLYLSRCGLREAPKERGELNHSDEIVKIWDFEVKKNRLQFSTKHSPDQFENEGVNSNQIEAEESFVQDMISLTKSGIVELPLIFHSKYPVVITGKPGEGKSVRMKQICSEIASNEDISETPIFLKAKHLAEKIYRYQNVIYVSDEDYDSFARPISSAFIQSNPDTEKFGLHEKSVLNHLIEIKSKFETGDGGIVLIVDAIDEIDDEHKIEDLLEWLEHYAQSFGGGYCRFVISTRPSHLHHVSEYFSEFSRLNMHFERETLQHDFPQKLVNAWTMGDDVANRARDLISDDDIFKHIDRPLLIGWLCRFIRDGEKDLGDLKESYSFFGKILNYAIQKRRFESENQFTETQIDSIKRMRDFIAFIDLLRLGNSNEVLRLNSRENRIRLLKIRNTGFFPGLDQLSDEEVHKLFFEDMSLVFVSGSGDIEWTHDHLREYAAALSFTLEEIRPGDLIEISKREEYSILNKNMDLEAYLSQRVFPDRPYFVQALRKLTESVLSRVKEQINTSKKELREPRSTIKTKNGEFNLNEIEYRMEFLSTRIENGRTIEPSEYVGLMNDVSLFKGAVEENVRQIRNEEFNKTNFCTITYFFLAKDISWLFPVLESSSSHAKEQKSYPELFTGGIIPRLSQTLLSENERKVLFQRVLGSDWESQPTDEESLKLRIFNHFIETSEQYDFSKYKTIWTKNYRPTQNNLDSNKLLIGAKYIKKYKKLYSDDKNSSKFFNYFQQYVQEKNKLTFDFRTGDKIQYDDVFLGKIKTQRSKTLDNILAISRQRQMANARTFNSNINDIVENKIPLIINILTTNFFFSEKFMSKLTNSYRKSSVLNPIKIIMMNFVSKSNANPHTKSEINYQLIDGNMRMIILISTIIEGYRRLDDLESMPNGFNRIFYQDNTDKGTFVDFLSRPEDYGEDVEIFVKNIHTILDNIENYGIQSLREAIQNICQGSIKISLIKSESCKECGSIEFETREDGDRYCKSCGALDEDSLYDFGPEG